MIIALFFFSFSCFLFTTAKVAYITAMITLHLILHSAVHIYDFHIFSTLGKTTLCTLHEVSEGATVDGI